MTMPSGPAGLREKQKSKKKKMSLKVTYTAKARHEEEVLLGTLKEHIRLNMLTQREKQFALWLIGFHERHGFLSDSNREKAYKMTQRIILERPVPGIEVGPF